MTTSNTHDSGVKILLNGTYVPIQEALKNKDTNGLAELLNNPELNRTSFPHFDLTKDLPGFESVKNINKDDKCQ